MDWLQVLSLLVHNTIVFATALIFAAMGGVISERSGVVNIALEGMMVIGAFTAAVVSYYVGASDAAPWIGFFCAGIAGFIFALPHAVASIRYHADQVVSGVALNFLAVGAALYLTKMLFKGAGQTPTIEVFSKWNIPLLSDIPYLGDAIFRGYPSSYIAFVLVAIFWFVLFKTPFGLRLRAVGEHPRAADTMGVKVQRTRYLAVMLSGTFAAFGGATLALTTTSGFSHTTVSGQGFIALAAVIFGKWHPVGAMFAALFFGVASALQPLLQFLGATKYIPVDFIYILPYVLTILVLAGLVGRAESPSALGKPYMKGGR